MYYGLAITAIIVGLLVFRRWPNIQTYFLALCAVFTTVFMVVYPDAAFESAVRGLKLWWDIVFPALLPFFIGSEILMGLGVVHFMGVMLEPFMRPIFNVPGEGSFVMAMGLASGYPIGSVLSAKLRRQGLCTKPEGERLMSFTNTADPLFMTGAVAVGMFGDIDLGGVIVGVHYVSSLLVGLVLRFFGGKAKTVRQPPRAQVSLLGRALHALVEARSKDGRPLGQLLGDSVRQSVNTLLLVGGFIILFSVIIRILSMVGLIDALTAAMTAVLAPLGVDRGVMAALVNGIFEVDIGAQAASKAPAPLIQKVMAANAIIAWSGLSVHAQVAAVIQGTDLKIPMFVAGRFLQAAFAMALTPWFMRSVLHSSAAWIVPAASPHLAPSTMEAWAWRLQFFSLQFARILVVMVAACALVYLYRRMECAVKVSRRHAKPKRK